MSWKRTAAKLLLAGALATGVTYYAKPELFDKAKPLVETVVSTVQSFFSPNNKEVPDITGKYSCGLADLDTDSFPAV